MNASMISASPIDASLIDVSPTNAWVVAAGVVVAGLLVSALSRAAGRGSLLSRPVLRPDRARRPRTVGPLRRLGSRLAGSGPLSAGSPWPEALRLIAREVRSGSSLGTAIETGASAEPALVALRALADQRRLAPAMVDGPTSLAPTANADDRLAIATLTHLLAHGGKMAASLDRVAATIHEREMLARERDVQAAQARLSARVLSLLAPAFAMWSSVSDRRVRSFLLTTLPGVACLGVGLALNTAGSWWMRRIVRQP